MTLSAGKMRKIEKGLSIRNIREASRLRILKILDDFQSNQEQVYSFEPGLTNSERAVVHLLCRQKGMKSKSSGKGKNRCVTISKALKIPKDFKQKKVATFLSFSEGTKQVFQDLFTQYPPNGVEQNEEIGMKHVAKFNKRRVDNGDVFHKPSMNKEEIARKVEKFVSRVHNDPKLRQIAEQRTKLPIASFKDSIISIIETNQVVLISGETGCGKTTQVPQYLLDHMWSKGETCKIVCTQPRRMSAISVAERISQERGENIGDNIGYKIRLETNGGKQSSVMFCTNGILLRILVGEGTCRSNARSVDMKSKDRVLELTHIIVDEIHERDRFSDFILAILRDKLHLYPHLRLVLMSATFDAERFSQYFGGCPIICVPGFTYPVKSYYLEDILSILKSTEGSHLDLTSLEGKADDGGLAEDYTSLLDEAINLAWSSDEFNPLLDLISSEGTLKICNYQHSFSGLSPLMVFAGKGRVSDVCMLLSFGANCHLRDKDGRTAMDWAQQENKEEVVEIIKQHLEKANLKSEEEQVLLEKYLTAVSPENIDIILIERLLRKICTDSKEGAILIFLPGWDEINKIREKLLSTPFFKDPSKFVVMSLHSMVPSIEQKKVFKRPPHGSRKIILSTNIAETSVTIDDVVYVIDSGRMKEKSYDPYNNVSTLQSSWVSKASMKQREGRAGRCQPGLCYHLYSKTRAASLLEFQIPEIKRMPIEELCLQVKLLDPNCKIVDFLQKTLDPPVSETINNAILVLQDIGALTLDEGLTELGEKLGSLPVHPSTSRMLFVSILMNSLDPALTLACASDYRDPFILPMAPDEKKKALDAKAELASLYGGYSDQLIVIAAYDCWEHAKVKGDEKWFCSKYFVSSSTMKMLSKMRVQLKKELIRNGFIPEDASHCSRNARDPGVLHAVLVAGLYPMVGKLHRPCKGGQRMLVETVNGANVPLHTHSCNYKLSFDKSCTEPLIVYDEITRGDGGMYIRNSSIVGPYPLLMLAREIVVAPVETSECESVEHCYTSDDGDRMELHMSSDVKHGERIMSNPDNTVSVVIDRWFRFETTSLDVAQIYCLRERLQAAILFKVKYPNKVLTPALAASMHAITSMFSFDGLSGISPSIKSFDKENEFSSSVARSLLTDDAPAPHHSRNNKPRWVSRTMKRNVKLYSNVQHPSVQLETGTAPFQYSQFQNPYVQSVNTQTVQPFQQNQIQGSMHRGNNSWAQRRTIFVRRLPRKETNTSQKSQLQNPIVQSVNTNTVDPSQPTLQGSEFGSNNSGGQRHKSSKRRCLQPPQTKTGTVSVQKSKLQDP